MNIQYQEHDIKSVFGYFVAAFDADIASWEANYDPHTG